MFSSELDMVKMTIPKLKSLFSDEEYIVIEEPKGLFGIPDIMIYNGSIISIEFKLSDWKRALSQAFRYRSYSEKSFVFLDAYYSHRAKSKLDLFVKYNVGLCEVDFRGINVIYEPEEQNPFSEELKNSALTLINNTNQDYKIKKVLTSGST